MKHGDYGLKYQVVHSRDGRAVHVSGPHAGAKHDLNIFTDTVPIIQAILKDPNFSWSLLADKGYVGSNALEGVNVHVPNKSTDILQLYDEKDSQDLSEQRVLCENFYGRVKSRYAFARETFRGSWSIHRVHFENVVALTNYHIQTHPLRNSNEESQFLQRLESVQRLEAAQSQELKAAHERASYKRKRAELSITNQGLASARHAFNNFQDRCNSAFPSFPILNKRRLSF